MEWADELAAKVTGPQVVNDSKTPSGTVHVGSLRGPVILDVIVRALRDRGLATTLLYGIDDLDPMDAQALLTPDAIATEMGKPLAHIADQEPDGHASYARHHAQVFIDLFADLGVLPDRYYWMSDIYPTGAMDGFIRTALDRADGVRDIYRRVANVRHPDSWLPVSVICPNCGRIGTTFATDWDGTTVAVACRRDLVTWAAGCGWTGRVAPFGGNAKLPWNLEWAAQWSLFGVTIEPGGKDLSTAGGSRDRSDAIAREVFEREPPINVPYEFLNIGGKKMSTSKGRGAAAHRITEVLPADQLRFLMIRHRPNHAIEFEPEGTDAVPRVFDDFDTFAAATAGREVSVELPPGFENTFGYALADRAADRAAEAAAFRVGFRRAAMFAQGTADPRERAAAEKGSELSTREVAILDERVSAAKAWLADYAPDDQRFEIWAERVPPLVDGLAAEQRQYLAGLADALVASREAATTGDAVQQLIFTVAKAGAIPPRQAFAAIYATFLNRANGPRAGWLLADLDRGFVVERLRAAAGSATLVA